MADAIDLLPRIILHPPGGAVVLGPIDPSSLTDGTVQLPVVGSVPYTVLIGAPTSQVVLHFSLGDVPIPVDPFSGSGGAGVVNLPMLGAVPYELVLGPPNIAPADMWGGGLASFLPFILIGGAAWLFLRKR